MKKVLEELGVEPERLCLAWISASEGRKFSETVREMVEEVKKIGPFDKSRLVYKLFERGQVLFFVYPLGYINVYFPSIKPIILESKPA